MWASNKQSLSLNLFSKFNYYTIGVFGLTTLYAFHVQFKNMTVRKQTFGRNFELIDEKYGKTHEEAFPGCKLSKLGYPDMGNNIYSDLLSYSDWLKVNNGQRCTEHF